jgi:tetratricopeptide (TPR) repeat protein/predicted Ser/Thr protein kinase/TolB-like protein
MTQPPPERESLGAAAHRAVGSSTLPAGATIGRFKVQALLGEGGMGAVYQAWDPVLERKVALKAIRLGAEGAVSTTERFRREAMALAQLNHRNVCQVHDWVEARGSAFIAMEFLEGKILSEVAKGMSLRQKLQALRAIAHALEAAHAKGIVHRDLKPGNVMVDATGQVKVLDFGLARLVDSTQVQGDFPTGPAPNLAFLQAEAAEGHTLLDSIPELPEHTSAGSAHRSPAGSWGKMTEVGVFMGSPTYASPEQMAGKRVGPPSDVFSLGVVAWELLLGDHPFPGEGRARMAATLEGALKPVPRRLPRRVAALLRAMLDRHAAKRPTSPEVAAALSRELAAPPAARWAWGSAAGLALVVGLGYILFGRSIIADLGDDQRPRLAVMPLRNDTGDPALDALVSVGMTELFTTALHGSPSLSVVEPESVARVMSGLRMGAVESQDPATQTRIAKALGARLFLRGTLRINVAESLQVLSYDLVDVSGRVRHAGVAKAARLGPFEPYVLVDPAAHDLLRKVDPLRSASHHNPAVPPEVFEAYANGKALFLKGDFKGSEAYLREASLKAPAFSAAVSAYASCLRRLGREQALPVANWALMSAKATGDRWAEGRAMGLKAFLAKDQGQLDEAQRMREASLALARTVGDRDGETIATNHLGLIAADRGQETLAKDFHEQSLVLSQQTGDLLYQSLAQNNLANLALKRGDLGAAQLLYQTNLTLQQGLGNRWGEALALNNLGVVALTARDLPAAEGLLNRALAMREAVGDKGGQVTCLRNLGILALMKGQVQTSGSFHLRAMELAQATALRTVEAECQFYVAELWRLQGRFAQAQEAYGRVIDLLPEGVTPGVRHNAQAAQAECLVRKPRPDLKAAERLLAALPTKDPSPFIHRARAWLAFAGGQRAQALDELAQAQNDPLRQAPELRAELDQTRQRFEGKLP